MPAGPSPHATSHGPARVAPPDRDGSLTAPRRLVVVQIALTIGAFAVGLVELLGALHLLTRPAITGSWMVALVVTVAVVARRRRRRPPIPPARSWATAARSWWGATTRGERLLAGGTAALVLAELVVALLAEPNNYDSQTYHLPKIEHWVAQGDLAFWATAIHRQVSIPPGAEYLLLHLRLLTGGDGLYNLVQWAAGVGCLLIATRITAQLGGGRRAQLLTAFVLASTPMVTLQATSTQTDLVVAAWVGCVATLVLDGLRRPAGVSAVLALGAATGLTAVTKTSGLIGAGPLLVLWGIAQLRVTLAGARVRWLGVLRVAGAALAVLAVAALLTGPFLLRVQAQFGDPLGPPQLRDSIPMQRHDPAAVLVNALRIGHTALDTPVAPLRDAGASAIDSVAGLLGVDPQDHAITFGTSTFPVQSWYPDEDRAAFPIIGILTLVGGVLALVRPSRLSTGHDDRLRAYALAVGAALVLHTAMIKWQPWGNRLLLYGVVLAAPLAGLWLDTVLRRTADQMPSEAVDAVPPRTAAAPGRRPVAAVVVTAVLAASALAGVLAISYGYPRRLVGAGSLLTTSDWDVRFLRRPQWEPEYRWAAGQVRAAGAHRIGLVEGNDDWEYPWWVLLRGGDRQIVALQSVVPGRPPADPAGVDAIVCTGARQTCARFVPPGWRFEFRGYVGYALPPAP